MPRRVAILLAVATFLLIIPAAAQAKGPRVRERRAGLWQQADVRPPTNSYEARRAYLNERYPKYIGGIHVRELDRFGLPPGDRGPRGNGFYATPW